MPSPKKKPTAKVVFKLTPKRCAALNPPHPRQLIVHEATGSAQFCVLCGKVLARERVRPPKRAPSEPQAA